MKKAFISVVVFSALTGLAHAEDSATIPFEKLDANSNGVLSIAEAGNLPEMSGQWSTLDQNGDGQLSPAEYSAYRAPAPAAGAN